MLSSASMSRLLITTIITIIKVGQFCTVFLYLDKALKNPNILNPDPGSAEHF